MDLNIKKKLKLINGLIDNYKIYWADLCVQAENYDLMGWDFCAERKTKTLVEVLYICMYVIHWGRLRFERGRTDPR